MAKKHNIFTPLLLQVDNPSEIFVKHRLELSKSAVEAVSYCVNNKLTNIVFVEIETIPSLSTLQLRVDQQSFLDVLDKNLETLEKFEEYEFHSLVKKYMPASRNLEKKDWNTVILSTPEDVFSILHLLKTGFSFEIKHLSAKNKASIKLAKINVK